MRSGVLYNYADYLPLNAKTPMFSLGEGSTPLVRSKRLEKELAVGEMYFKLEGCNPTGSFKDRGMVVAIAKAIEEGSKAVICASTGNTSASATAYASAMGLKSIIIIPGGKIALGKLAQAIAYGASIIAINGNFDQALQLVRDTAAKHPVSIVNSINPNRIEGQKTAAFEIVDSLGQAPDYLFIPVGNAGNITAYWKGFTEYQKLGMSPNRPKMMGFQAEGAAPIVLGRPVEYPETIATAIRIGNPASWEKATAARDESGGIIDKVSDEEILRAWKLLASKEGVFGEPASAAPLAGIIKLRSEGYDFSSKRVVCIITGNGLKDADVAIKQAPAIEPIKPELSAVEKALGWNQAI
ncbi:MAG: threonine synthase [Dehalococcoidales bacterium]|nr:threonine synthase [Dehalococcoidales bacterium]